MAKHGRTHQQQARVQNQHKNGQQKPEHRPRQMRKPVQRTPAWVAPTAVIGAFALIVVAFLAYRYMTTPPPLPPASADTTAQVVATITSLPPSQLEQVGQGSANNVLKRISAAPLTDATGKPIVFYYGAEYCPYCAAERWPMIVALSRFGTFTGLATTSSSSTDVFPNTPTFTFHGSAYTSNYIVFQSIEFTDRNGNPLETPSAAQQALVTKYDTSNTIPFLVVGNKFVLLQPSYSPDTLAGKNWSEVATALTNPQSSEAQAILGSANQLTAAICALTSNEPATVCTPAIQAIGGKL
jgi:hypothetical protein